MKLLLDTHTWLWFYLGDRQLSSTAKKAILDPANAKFVSPASYWELAIKISLAKYALAEPYEEFVQHAVIDNGFTVVPVESRHTAMLVSLPYHHKDPFDRLIVAQAVVENLQVVSADAILGNYPIHRVW